MSHQPSSPDPATAEEILDSLWKERGVESAVQRFCRNVEVTHHRVFLFRKEIEKGAKELRFCRDDEHFDSIMELVGESNPPTIGKPVAPTNRDATPTLPAEHTSDELPPKRARKCLDLATTPEKQKTVKKK